MKVHKAIIRAAALVLVLSMTVPAANASGVPGGAVTGKVLYSDIKVIVDGREIPAYTIDGYTVVVAEDLRSYGFNVIWNGTNRTLSISLDTSGRPVTASAPNYSPRYDRGTPGAVAGDVLATDIVTDLTDFWGSTYEIRSWNIGGWTAVGMDELKKAYASYYGIEENEIHMNVKSYTDWSVDLSAPQAADELTRGFAVKVTGVGGDVKVEGEGSWGGVDELTLSPTAVSFLVRDRVKNNYDGCLDGLDRAAGRTQDVSAGSGKEQDQPELHSFMEVFRLGANDLGGQVVGKILISRENGQTAYTYRFDAPLELSEDDTLYIIAGDAFWVADRQIPLRWAHENSYRVNPRCEILAGKEARVYYCETDLCEYRTGNHESLYVVWPDGTRREYIGEIYDIGLYSRWYEYRIEDVRLSEDGESLTCIGPVFTTYGEWPDPDWVVKLTGTGSYRIDLATGEMTLESVSPILE